MTDEPKHFKTEESRKKYMDKKQRELLWLAQKVKDAKTPEQKDKAKAKLDKWLDNHPQMKALLKKMFLTP